MLFFHQFLSFFKAAHVLQLSMSSFLCLDFGCLALTLFIYHRKDIFSIWNRKKNPFEIEKFSISNRIIFSYFNEILFVIQVNSEKALVFQKDDYFWPFSVEWVIKNVQKGIDFIKIRKNNSISNGIFFSISNRKKYLFQIEKSFFCDR